MSNHHSTPRGWAGRVGIIFQKEARVEKGKRGVAEGGEMGGWVGGQWFRVGSHLSFWE